MKVIVKDRRVIATDIVLLQLSDPSGRPLPAFSAGAHVDVHVSDNLVRQYSLCNNPANSQTYSVAVLKDPKSRGGSIAVHELQQGQTVEISEPRNNFPLARDATHSILFAGGIGITPILSMAERLRHLNASFELHYCTRSKERTAFLDRLERGDLAKYVHHYFDENGGAAEFADILEAPKSGVHVYVCGPMGFIDAVLDAAHRCGWSDDHLHREYFASAPTGRLKNAAFQVVVASSGKVVEVDNNTSIVDALKAEGYDIPVSCEQGVCGTCLTRVLDGEPDHRDLYLTDEEKRKNDQMMPCCSRSLSARLVLDV